MKCISIILNSNVLRDYVLFQFCRHIQRNHSTRLCIALQLMYNLICFGFIIEIEGASYDLIGNFIFLQTESILRSTR